MFGSHLSIAGGLHHALVEASKLSMDCVQVFTKNQRQWRVPPLTPEALHQWHAHRASTRIEQVVSHDSYLINLASPDEGTLSKSLALFEEELKRCEALGIPWLVTHPGAHLGQGEAAGLKRVARSLDELHLRLPDAKVITCLEITAGQGTSLGHTFEHLAAIIQQVAQPERLGVCLDTAHLLAAGYDLTSAAGCRNVIRSCEEALGPDRVRVLHVNDSKTPRGSRVDRHAHIGQGHVAMDAFAEMLNHPRFSRLPKILETPKEQDAQGRDMDRVNMERLKNLLGIPPG